MEPTLEMLSGHGLGGGGDSVGRKMLVRNFCSEAFRSK